MGKMYHLDLETLLSILDNGQYQLTTTLTISSAPATAFVMLAKGKITSYCIQLRDGRRIDGDQVFNLLLAQPQWDVQPVENRLQPARDTHTHQSGEYKRPSLTPMPASNYKQPTPTPPPASTYKQPTPTPPPAPNRTTPTQPPAQSQQPIPRSPYQSTNARPLTSGMGQGPAQTAATEPNRRRPLTSGMGQGPAQTAATEPNLYKNTPAQSTSTTNPQYQLQQTSPDWQNPITPPWSYVDTAPVLPAGNLLNPQHRWRQKCSLQSYHLTNIPSQQRRTLHTVLTMVNGRRTTAEIQSALGLPPDVIIAAIGTLANLNVIE